MYDKYKDVTIFEIENGWILKVEKNDPHKADNISFTSTYYLDKKALLKALEKEL